jgi:hypothetical protein
MSEQTRGGIQKSEMSVLINLTNIYGPFLFTFRERGVCLLQEPECKIHNK